MAGRVLSLWIAGLTLFSTMQPSLAVAQAAKPMAEKPGLFVNLTSDDTWRGWWGDEPPYRVPVFVLTHHARSPIEMRGGTTFHFVTTGIRAALDAAREAADGRDVRIGGGVATLRQYLQAGLVDEVHLAVSPIVLGRGEHLFAGLDLPALGYRVAEHVASARTTHVVLAK